MTEHLLSLWGSLVSTIDDVLPIIGIMVGFQVLILRRSIPNLKRVLLGFLLVLLGLAFFLEGLERALFPLGKLMAEQLTAPDFLGLTGEETSMREHWGEFVWVYLFAFAIGFSTTIAEPSLIAVAIKANQVSAGTIHPWGLRIAVAIGVAIGIALGVLPHRHRHTVALLHHHRLRHSPLSDLVRPAYHHRPGLRLRRRDHLHRHRPPGGGPGAGACRATSQGATRCSTASGSSPSPACFRS